MHIAQGLGRGVEHHLRPIPVAVAVEIIFHRRNLAMMHGIVLAGIDPFGHHVPIGDPGDDGTEGIGGIAPRDRHRASHRTLPGRRWNRGESIGRLGRPETGIESGDAAGSGEKVADNRAARPERARRLSGFGACLRGERRFPIFCHSGISIA
jgi:hypothetical protein